MCLLSTPDIINTNVEFSSAEQKCLFVSKFDHCGRLELLFSVIRIYDTVKMISRLAVPFPSASFYMSSLLYLKREFKAPPN